MPQIVIQGTPIAFPDDAASPDWAPAVIAFAQAVESALNLVINAFDVSPQVYTMVSNSNTNVNINALSFPTANVRAAFITYSVYRTTSLSNASEAGQIIVVYNANSSVGSKWELIQSKDGNAQVSFNITDTGQVQFSSVALSGINHSGQISFSAKTLQQL